jgi:hypothetical protein
MMAKPITMSCKPTDEQQLDATNRDSFSDREGVDVGREGMVFFK